MKILTKLIKKIAYVFISMNQDIKLRYQTEMEVENEALQSQSVNSR